MLIVDVLEAIQVEEDQGHRRAVALAALHLAAQRRVQVTRVVELRQVVRDGQLFGAPQEERVVHGHGRRLQEERHEPRVIAPEAAGGGAIHSFQDADHPAAAQQRDRQDRARREVLRQLRRAVGGAVHADVFDQDGLAQLRRPARDPFPQPDPRPPARGQPLAAGLLHGQQALLRVGEQEQPGAQLQEGAHLLHRQIDDAVGIELVAGGAHDRRQGAQRHLLAAGLEQDAADPLAQLADLDLALDHVEDLCRVERRGQRDGLGVPKGAATWLARRTPGVHGQPEGQHRDRRRQPPQAVQGLGAHPAVRRGLVQDGRNGATAQVLLGQAPEGGRHQRSPRRPAGRNDARRLSAVLENHQDLRVAR